MVNPPHQATESPRPRPLAIRGSFPRWRRVSIRSAAAPIASADPA